MENFNVRKYSIEPEATGKQIVNLMKQNKMKARELADYLGISVQSVSKWCHGVSLPSLDNLAIMAGLFRVKMDDIIVLHHQLEQEEKNWIVRRDEPEAMLTDGTEKENGTGGVRFVVRKEKTGNAAGQRDKDVLEKMQS